jgi:hypothetical protein
MTIQPAITTIIPLPVWLNYQQQQHLYATTAWTGRVAVPHHCRVAGPDARLARAAAGVAGDRQEGDAAGGQGAVSAQGGGDGPSLVPFRRPGGQVVESALLSGYIHVAHCCERR